MTKALFLALTMLISANTFAVEGNYCTSEEVSTAALTIGQLYKDVELDGIEVVSVRKDHVGTHAVENYDLWLTSAGEKRIQISLGFVKRWQGNFSYKKVGCGLITTSIPFYQAP